MNSNSIDSEHNGPETCLIRPDMDGERRNATYGALQNNQKLQNVQSSTEISNVISSMPSEQRNSKEHVIVKDGIKIKPLLMVASTMLLLTFSMYLCLLILAQYIYIRYFFQLHPNETLPVQGNGNSCNVDTNSKEYKLVTSTQEVATNFSIIATVVGYIPAIMVNFALGSLSDKFGRRKMLIINSSFSFLRSGLHCIGVHFNVNINYFFIFYAVDALGGGLYGAIGLGFAYAADIAPRGTSRTLAITSIEMAIGVGAILASIVSGYLIKFVGFFYSMICVLGINFFCSLICLFLLPESIQTRKENRTAVLENIRNAFMFYFRDTSNEGKRWKYIICLLTFVMVALSTLGKTDVEPLYVLNVPFCWSSVSIGWYAAGSVMGKNLLGMGSIKIVSKYLQDTSLAIASVLSTVVTNIFEGLASNNAMMFIVPVLGIYNMVAFPVLRSMMSQMTSPEKQGALFSGISAAETISSFASSELGKLIYRETVVWFRGTTFFVMALYSLIALCLLLVYRSGSRKTEPKQIEDEIYVSKKA